MSTVCVTLCDELYYPKALQTIEELKTIGNWKGDIVLIAVDFDPDPLVGVEIHRVNHIDTNTLFEEYAKFPHLEGDGRYLKKTVQWNKFYVFTEFFKRWNRVFFIDAGMRVLNRVKLFFELDCKDSLLAPDDGAYPEMGVRFRQQLDIHCNPKVYTKLIEEYSESILDKRYFLNCMFLFDTSLLDKITFDSLIETMNKYPICKCNEMTVMNLVCTFKHNVWKILPRKIGNLYTFGWNESPNNSTPGVWKDFFFMKYPFKTPDRICDDINTAFVTLSDVSYYKKALHTIDELRTAGGWAGDIVFIAVDFDPKPIPGVQIYKTTHINTHYLLEQFRKHPIRAMSDNRHFGKVYQWDKLQVFKNYFRQWCRIVFVDAGLRIFNSVQPLLDLSWKGKLLAPDDSDPYDNGSRFARQLDLDANPEVTQKLFMKYPVEICEMRYFNNPIFVFDTSMIGNDITFDDLEKTMNTFPIFLCNETGLMNLIFNYTLRVWSPFPQRVGTKYLFGWAESNYKENPTWRDFHFIKYSITYP
jgi:hypothetical protein